MNGTTAYVLAKKKMTGIVAGIDGYEVDGTTLIIHTKGGDLRMEFPKAEGKSLEFRWSDDYRLGVRVEGEEEYTYSEVLKASDITVGDIIYIGDEAPGENDSQVMWVDTSPESDGIDEDDDKDEISKGDLEGLFTESITKDNLEDLFGGEIGDVEESPDIAELFKGV